MTDLRQALAAADADLRGAVEVADLARVSDADLVQSCREIEALARLIDGARVIHAAELARRAESRAGVAAALGARGAVDAVAQVSGISGSAAKRRIRTGAAITVGASATGEATPPRFPVIAAAVLSGRLGIEAAGILVARLETLPPTTALEVVRSAETSLVDAAVGGDGRPPLSVELIRGRAADVVADIDHAGVRTREERARRRRTLRFGQEDADGLTSVHGTLLPVVAAQFRRLCDAYMKARPTFSGPDGLTDASSVDGTHGEAVGRRADPRSREQQRHDVLGAILSAASRVADAPHLAGAPPAVLVTVTRTVLDERTGVGHIDGTETPVSLDTVEALIDEAGSQEVTLDGEGACLSLGSVQRCFTPSQRRAIIARDGGCLIPGCPIPAGWSEVHHVVPYRSGGATHVSNGVLLCWWHHHIIDSGPWRLRMVRGVPQVRRPGLFDWAVATKRRSAHRSDHPPGRDLPPPPPGADRPPPAAPGTARP